MGRFSDAMDQVITVAPDLKNYPGLAVGLARVEAQPDQVAAVAAVNWAMNRARYMDRMPDDKARYNFWQSLADADKEKLRRVGVAEPKKPGKRGGIMGLLVGAADAVSNVADFVVPEAVEDAIGGTAGAVTAPFKYAWDFVGEAGAVSARAVQHSYRAYTTLEQLNEQGQGSPWKWSDWADAWHSTTKGAETYNPKALQEIRDKYDERTFTYAKRISDGLTLDNVPAEEFQQVYELTQTPKFNEALAELQNAHMSVGRDFARKYGWDPTVTINDTEVHLVSGTIDGFINIAFDPTLVGAKFYKAAQVAKYGTKGVEAQRVLKLMEEPAVRRAWQTAADHLATIQDAAVTAETKGEAFRRLQLQPGIKRFVPGMIDHGVKSLDDIQEYLVNSEGLAKLAVGEAAYRRPLMPTLTKWGEAKIATKEALRKPINWLEEGHLALADDLLEPTEIGTQFNQARKTWRGRAATLIARQEKVPVGEKLMLDGDDAAENVRLLARTFGPARWADQTAALYLAADTAGRRTIIKGMFATLGEASGITVTPEGRKFWHGFLDDFDGLAGNTIFSPNGADILEDTHKAVRTSQLRGYVSLPNFKDMYAQASRIGLLDRAGAALNKEAIDAFTTKWWKPSVLLRPALPIRNATEEVANHILREGIGDLAGGYAGASLLKGDKEAGRVFRAFTAHLPAPARARIVDTRSWLIEHTTDKVKTFTAKTVLSKEEQRFITDLAGDKHTMTMFARELTESAQKAARMTNDAEILDQVRRGHKLRAVSLHETGDYAARRAEGIEGARRWNLQLTDIAENPEGRVALEHIADESTALAKLTELIEGESFARHRAASEIYAAEGAQGWARRIFDDAKLHVSDPDGNLIPDLLDKITDGGQIVPSRITTALLDEVDEALRPSHVVGKDYIAIADPSSWVGKIVADGYTMFGDWHAFLSKQPIAIANYLDVRKTLAGFEKQVVARMGQKQGMRLVLERATNEALERTLMFTDNPEVRSQFAVAARNVLPFWRAQEEFYRRWARTAQHSPEAFRKAQLTMDGLRHSGWIQKDDEGNEFFIYPATGAVQSAMVKASALIGLPMAQLPVPSVLTGQVKFLNQGLDSKNILPSAGPILAVPAGLMAHFFPELAPVEKALVGERYAGRKPIMGIPAPILSLLPTPVRRAITALDPDERTSQMASAWRNAIAQMEAAGLAPPADATPAQIDEYLERVKNGARTNMAMRFIFGLAAPAAPEAMDAAPKATDALRAMGIANVREEYFALVEKLGVEEGSAAFLKAHPDGTPWTVSHSESTSGAYTPSTEAALAFLEQHKDFFKAFPKAAAYMIPQESGDFDRAAYTTQLANEMRTLKLPLDMYKDLKLRGTLDTYFTNRKVRDDFIKEARDRGDKDAVNTAEASWSTWSDEYLAVNPLVKEYLADGSARALDRQQIVEELTLALDSKLLPDVPAVARMKLMLEAWQAHVTWRNENPGLNRQAQDARRNEASGFNAYLLDIAGTDPNALTLYNRVFRYLEA